MKLPPRLQYNEMIINVDLTNVLGFSFASALDENITFIKHLSRSELISK